MEIREIIKSDYDRLFIVDPECFIIFTGNSADDDKPFIRIGNWIDLPTELIPLVENIIITDTMIGDPSCEQFNIDIRNLSANRYIGSGEIVQRYLDFQKIFGLDLTKAPAVDIERDLPELSKEKNISEKNQFIGVFYRDGNFKTVYNKVPIVDLNQIGTHCPKYSDLNMLLSREHGKEERFRGSGIVIVEHNPMFYSRGVFASYLFPSRYLEAFSKLGIDPAMIRDLIYPSINMIQVTKFLKWKDGTGGSIAMYSDHAGLVRFLKRLFTRAGIVQKGFSGFSSKSGDGMTVENYHGSYNIKIAYPNISPGAPISVAFVKGAGGIKDVMRDGLDCIIIAFSVFEDVNLLLRTSKTPVAVIDDGNRNISKLSEHDTVVLRPGIQYEFEKHSSAETLLASLGLPDELDPAKEDHAAWALNAEGSMEKPDGSFRFHKTLFNISAAASILISMEKDRKLSSRLKDLNRRIQGSLKRDILFRDPSAIAVTIAFFGGAVFQFITESGARGGTILFDEIADMGGPMHADVGFAGFFERIRTDRIRLMKLLSMFTESDKYRARHGADVQKLRIAIEERKEMASTPDVIPEDAYRAAMFKGDSGESLAGEVMRSSAEPEAESLSPLSSRIKRTLSGKRRYAAILLILLLAASGIYTVARFSPTTWLSTGTEKEPLSREDAKKLETRYGITIQNVDIFRYANRIAVLNGYNRIPYQALKRGKNPDWIHPSNVFRLTDGEKVVVKKGDTLWALSRDKLIRMSIEFHETVEKIRDLGGAEKNEAIARAKKLAFTKEHSDILAQVTVPSEKNGKK